MTDATLVQRLRNYGLTLEESVVICDRRVVDEAADEIDRLTAELAEARAKITADAAGCAHLLGALGRIEGWAGLAKGNDTLNAIHITAKDAAQSFLDSKGE